MNSRDNSRADAQDMVTGPVRSARSESLAAEGSHLAASHRRHNGELLARLWNDRLAGETFRAESFSGNKMDGGDFYSSPQVKMALA
ncbi:MAG TPA: hypothetical protein VKS20_11020 [Candidatus Acidoferrales bacterium]|nr:hypothetical protein [Candidatus Acidoferrales bacterium]